MIYFQVNGEFDDKLFEEYVDSVDLLVSTSLKKLYNHYSLIIRV